MPTSTASKPELATLLRWLEEKGTQEQITSLSRYGITANRPYGVAMSDLKSYSKSNGKDHDLAMKLWTTERYESPNSGWLYR